MKKLALNILSETITDENYLNKYLVEGFKIDLYFEPVESRVGNIPFISDLHVNRFSKFLYHVMAIAGDKGLSGSLRILFSEDVVNFDHTLLGIIALFKKNFPKIDFEISIPNNAGKEVYQRFRSILFSTREWYNEMYNVNLYKIRNEKSLDKNLFLEPEVILPIIQITADSFQNLFVKTEYSVDLVVIFSDVPKDDLQQELMTNLSEAYATSATASQKNYRALRSTLRTFNEALKLGNNNRIFLTRYLKLISEFDLLPSKIEALLPSELVDVKLDRFRKRGLSDSQMMEVKRTMRTIVSKLVVQPPMFCLLFSILVNRNLTGSIDDYKEYINRLNNLFEFSRNLFLGLKELARNIVEHTEKKSGMLCGRIYRGEILQIIKNDEGNSASTKMMNTYFRTLQDKEVTSIEYKEKAFLDITLFDEGRIGIVNKTIENIGHLTSNKRNENGLYYQDLKALEAGKITFQDFYNPTEIKLNHHAIKSSSHWGLIVFANLINRNNGLFFVSSVSDLNQLAYDSCFKSGDHIVSPARTAEHFAVGTFYNIVLPLDSIFSLSSDTLINTVPGESNFSEKSFSDLLKYTFVKKTSLIVADGRHNLLHIPIERTVKKEGGGYRSENLMAQGVAKHLKTIIKQKQKVIPVVDFEGCEDLFDPSKLIRFLAELQSVLEIYSLILINLPVLTTRDLFSTLSEAFSGDQKELALRSSFWNPGHFILVYSFQEDDSSSRLYSANILGGVNYWDFFILNQKIAATHFTDAMYNVAIKDKLTAGTWDGLKTSPLYATSTDVLQNFEMIIEFNGRTLFEHSIQHILNQEIADQ